MTMVRRQLLVLALVVLTLHAYAEATSFALSCPRSLETVLESAVQPHMGRLLTTASTTIKSTDVRDVFLDSLRALVAASASIPCVANVNFTPTRGHSHMRRFVTSGPFKGKLNCTFDMAAPLNLSNPRQSFIMECKEIFRPDEYPLFWIVLGVLGGPVVHIFLFLFIVNGIAKIKNWRGQRAPRYHHLDETNEK